MLALDLGISFHSGSIFNEAVFTIFSVCVCVCMYINGVSVID
jgi:hypothetical protein